MLVYALATIRAGSGAGRSTIAIACASIAELEHAYAKLSEDPAMQRARTSFNLPGVRAGQTLTIITREDDASWFPPAEEA